MSRFCFHVSVLSTLIFYVLFCMCVSVEQGFDGVGVPPTSKYNHQFVEVLTLSFFSPFYHCFLLRLFFKEMKANGFSKAFIGLTFN